MDCVARAGYAKIAARGDDSGSSGWDLGGNVLSSPGGQTMKRLVLAATAVVAALVVAAPGGAQSSGGRTLKLSARTGPVSLVDLPPAMKRKSPRPSAGDEVVFTDKVSGDASGTEHVACVVTKAGKTIEKSLVHCTGTVVLKDGTLEFGVELGLADATSSGAITGGSGAYAGARGTLAVQQGSQDSSTQTITLEP
jgi:hypothetical protein